MDEETKKHLIEIALMMDIERFEMIVDKSIRTYPDKLYYAGQELLREKHIPTLECIAGKKLPQFFSCFFGACCVASYLIIKKNMCFECIIAHSVAYNVVRFDESMSCLQSYHYHDYETIYLEYRFDYILQDLRNVRNWYYNKEKYLDEKGKRELDEESAKKYIIR